ncbi:MAG TPA: Ig-like domain-containing protein, partial [Candidatus Limnocylindrales bacterium]|nr:Ig-like domain-containing protein [Candidatus Limnocylindrales bacterium]
TKTATATIRVATGAVATVQIEPEAAEIVRTTTKQLLVTVLNASGGVITGRPVTWMTDDPTIASVSGAGVVTAVEFGQTSITAIVDGVRGSAAIVVGAGPIQRMEITPGPVTLTMLETANLKAHPFDDVGNEVTFADVAWTSSDPSVATVAGGGHITPVGPGTTTITATSEGVAASVTVTVTNPMPASIAITPRPSSLEQGESVQLATVVKDAAGHVMAPAVTWRSTDPALVSISNGKITGIAVTGSPVRIIASVAAGPSATIADTLLVTVGLATPARVTVTIDRSPIEVTEDTWARAVVVDGRGEVLTGRTITWTTSNPAIVGVQPNGIVFGSGPGTATVTATCGSRSGSATITVRFSADPVASVILTLPENPIVPGMTTRASAAYFDGGGHPTGPRPSTWHSSNPHVATVDANGVIEGLKPGWTTITVTSEGVSDSELLKVLNPNVFIMMPMPHAVIPQNDPRTGASYDPARGYGYRVDIHWMMVMGATGYEVATAIGGDERESDGSTVTVTKSKYAFVQPNVWVPAGTELLIKVRALGLPGGPGPWATRTVTFGKCELLDGTACGTPHVRVQVHTTGGDMPKFYGATLTPPDGEPSKDWDLPVNGHVDIPTTFGDGQIVRLLWVPSNCAVESTTQTVSLSETDPFRTVSFEVVCREQKGETGPGL